MIHKINIIRSIQTQIQRTITVKPFHVCMRFYFESANCSFGLYKDELVDILMNSFDKSNCSPVEQVLDQNTENNSLLRTYFEALSCQSYEFGKIHKYYDSEKDQYFGCVLSVPVNKHMFSSHHFNQFRKDIQSSHLKYDIERAMINYQDSLLEKAARIRFIYNTNSAQDIEVPIKIGIRPEDMNDHQWTEDKLLKKVIDDYEQKKQPYLLKLDVKIIN
eukprot:387454_1